VPSAFEKNGDFLDLLESFRFALVLVLLCVPAFFFAGESAFALFFVRMLVLAAFLLTVTRPSLDWGLIGRSRTAHLASLAFLGFVVYVFLQGAAGPAVYTKLLPGSIMRFDTFQQAEQLVFYFLFFVACLDAFSKDSERTRTAIFILGWEVLLLAALGYYQSVKGFDSIYGFFRIPEFKDFAFFSTFSNSNHYGSFLALSAPLFLALMAHAYEGRARRSDFSLFQIFFLMALIPVMAISVFCADARAPFVMMLVVVTVFFFIAFSGRSRLIFMAVLSLLASGIIGLIFVSRSRGIRQTFLDLPASLLTRLSLYGDTLQIFKDFPLFGTGLGTYRWIAKNYQSVDVSHMHRFHSNNDHIELLAETGLVGYALLAVALGTLVWKSFLKSRRGASWDRILGASCFVSLLVFMATLFFDSYLRTPAVALLFVFQLALLANTALSPGSGAREEQKPDQRRARFSLNGLAAGLGVTLILSGFALREYRSARITENQAAYFDAEQNDIRYKHMDIKGIEAATAWNPDNPRLWAALGRNYLSQASQSQGKELAALVRQAIEAYNRATELAPTYPDYWLSLGRAKILAQDHKNGLEHIAHAISLQPNNRDLYLYAVYAYLKMADKSSWSHEKRMFDDEAMRWLEETSRFENPLSKEDYSYLYFPSERMVGPDDKGRIQRLFDRQKQQKNTPAA